MLANRLIHRCTVERASGAANAWGGPSGDWADHLADLPCRLWANAGRETVENQTTVAVVEDLRLLLQLGTDVAETDRLGDVTDRDATILAGPVSIRAVLRHRDHIELVLVRAA